MTIALIDYGAGNLHSVHNALRAAGAHGVVVTSDAEVVRRADRIVLPGVGAFRACIEPLRAIPGMIEAMHEAVFDVGRPFLGICVGMQLMASVGVEFGEHKGLDWIKGKVVVLDPADRSLRIPQMGWNNLDLKRAHPVLADTKAGDHAYFVHSYHLVAERPQDVIATVDYGGPVTAIIGRDNLLGVQFHPEKSQHMGLTLLARFLKWIP